jgi:hypothetical protein
VRGSWENLFVIDWEREDKVGSMGSDDKGQKDLIRVL